jgi:hypothetical protein
MDLPLRIANPSASRTSIPSITGCAGSKARLGTAAGVSARLRLDGRGLRRRGCRCTRSNRRGARRLRGRASAAGEGNEASEKYRQAAGHGRDVSSARRARRTHSRRRSGRANQGHRKLHARGLMACVCNPGISREREPRPQRRGRACRARGRAARWNPGPFPLSDDSSKRPSPVTTTSAAARRSSRSTHEATRSKPGRRVAPAPAMSPNAMPPAAPGARHGLKTPRAFQNACRACPLSVRIGLEGQAASSGLRPFWGP